MKAPETKFVEVTVLRLIASNIIKLKIVEIDDKKKVTISNIVIMENQIDPFFLSDKAWIS